MAFVGSKTGQSAAVHVDVVIPDQVRISFFGYAVGGEIDAPGIFVHSDDVAHIPFPLGDLIFNATAFAVVEVEVVPIVAFAHPNDFFVVSQIVAETARIIDEGFGCFFDQAAYKAILSRHFQYTVDFVRPFVVFEGNAAVVFVPAQTR